MGLGDFTNQSEEELYWDRNSELQRIIRELRDQLVDANKSLASAEEVIESISELFPDNACHKHPETGVSLLDDVIDVITKYSDLDGECYNLHIQFKAATARAEAAEKALAVWEEWFGCENPHDTEVAKYTSLGKEQARANVAENRAEAAERERDEARAHAADLRGAMEEARQIKNWDRLDATIDAALARTAPQSLEKLKAGALREAANKYEAAHIEHGNYPPGEDYDGGFHDGQYAAVNWLMGEVARLRKEATDGR